jgi:hypothetical protein
MSWLDDAQARIAAAKLIVDDETRIALWRLVVSDWLLGCDLHEPEEAEAVS